MTDIESIEFKKVGILDAFNSDGLRSLLDMPIPYMAEKTLRFPGHIQKIIEMRNNGLFEADKINETAQSLIREWMPGPEDYDQTILRLQFEGIKNGNNLTQIYDLIDYYDKQKNISSMARTTGYTCASVANILLSGTFSQKGVFAMETLASDSKIFDFIISYLSNRNIQFESSAI
jgi:saccharopine dehydrogenase-like NADP-dependent oxidoreductase